MNNSNYTLRFSRTAREAFGHDVTFDDDRHARFGLLAIVALAFALGVMVGALVL